jgi:DUF4097 and DUF4098 domain-containing protein YvlB
MGNEMSKWLVMFALSLLPLSAVAKDVNEKMDADAKSNVEIYNTAGSVKVEGWSRNEVEVIGTLGNEVDEFIFERDDEDILIKVKAKSGRSGHRGHSSNLAIKVPQDSSIDVATVSADIEIKGVYGELEATAVSGDIDLETFAAKVEAETVSGDIEARGDGKGSDIELVSVSGDITAVKLAGELQLEAVSGDIELTNGSFDDANVQTVNGDIEFEANLRKGGEIAIETVNGTINVDFVGDVSAEFEIETFNGRIRNCFGPEPERVSKYAPGYELNFTEAGGDGRVSIATMNGNLNLCKK